MDMLDVRQMSDIWLISDVQDDPDVRSTFLMRYLTERVLAQTTWSYTWRPVICVYQVRSVDTGGGGESLMYTRYVVWIREGGRRIPNVYQVRSVDEGEVGEENP